MSESPAAAPAHTAGLPDQIAAGHRPALARAISIVENQSPGFRALLHTLHPRVGRAQRIGITGPPGAGKSTLVAALVAAWRARNETVAVIAVDPTSPFTGGALLGDRIRMNEVALDRGVFIRSMATRGSVGGLALTTEEVADVLDAAGFQRILIETVGVGQTELDIAAAADTTVVVLVPESGDGIQAMKAGLMEVSDIFVINKADRPGADRMARDVSMTLHLRAGRAMRNVPAHHGVDLRRAAAKADAESKSKDAASSTETEPWDIPVLQTVAHEEKGITELAETLDRHFAWLTASGERDRRRRTRLMARVRAETDRSLRRRVWQELGGQRILDAAGDALVSGEQSPYEVAARIVDAVMDGSGRGAQG
jgi:LAO/AO transport system kinase